MQADKRAAETSEKLKQLPLLYASLPDIPESLIPSVQKHITSLFELHSLLAKGQAPTSYVTSSTSKEPARKKQTNKKDSFPSNI